jgi:hypothetical protein
MPRRFAANGATLGVLLAPLRFGGSVLVYALLARAWLFRELGRVQIAPFYYNAHCCSPYQLAHWAREDVAFACRCTQIALVVAICGLMLSWLRKRGSGRVGETRSPRRVSPKSKEVVPSAGVGTNLGHEVLGRVPSAHLPALLGLFGVGLVHALYYKVAFVLHVQLDLALLGEAIRSGFGVRNVLAYLSPADVFLVAAPVVPYLALRAQRPLGRVLQSLPVVLCAFAVYDVPDPGRRAPARPLCLNPVAAVLSSAVTQWDAPRPFAALDTPPTPGELACLGLAELSAVPPRARLGAGTPSASIVVVILESVGRRYAFDGQGPEVMPNLAALRDDSLFLANHLSPANNSPNALFSFFTGLYPSPESASFASRADLHLPVLHSFLSDDRDAFLFTPGDLSYYFPWGLLSDSKIELHDRDSLGLAQLRPRHWEAADERDGVDAFLARLDRTRAPFFAVYYSYAAHYPYFDYGPEFRVMQPEAGPFARYVNNLRLLDTQLKRIIDAVHARKEPTLLVVLGDHGEAFGQHPDNFAHAGHSFQENFETFALLHLPGTFPKQVIHERTLHIDLAPTILAGLGVPFEPSQFQGRDVLGPAASRPEVFLSGQEDTLSSIDASGIKLQLLYASGECRAFDLSRDPEEQAPRACDAFPEQMRRTALFHRFQPRLLNAHRERLVVTAPRAAR